MRKPAEDVGGDGGDLEADEDHEELDRAGHEHHADGAEEDEGEVLAGVAGVAFEVVERAEQGDENDGADEQWKRTEKASTWMVSEKAWMRDAEVRPDTSWRRRRATVPAMAIQPRGLRLEAGLRHGSASMMRTPARVRMNSGSRAEDVGGHLLRWPPLQ